MTSNDQGVGSANGELHIECQHCEYQWEYTGEKEYPGMVSCPNCYYKVRLPE